MRSSHSRLMASALFMANIPILARTVTVFRLGQIIFGNRTLQTFSRGVPGSRVQENRLVPHGRDHAVGSVRVISRRAKAEFIKFLKQIAMGEPLRQMVVILHHEAGDAAHQRWF